MNFLAIIAVIFFAWIILAPKKDAHHPYDKGYEAAWEGEKAPHPWSSQEEKEGYEDGMSDSDMWDEGYDDGIERKRPKYFNHYDYMEGYKEGKKRKKSEYSY